MEFSLTTAAAQHNGWMAYTNTLSHRLSGEHSLGYRVTACHYIWQALGENLGVTTDWSSAGVAKLQSMMYAEGPGGGHYVNLMNSTYRDVGVSVSIDATHHKAWLTVDFGRQM